MTSLAEIDVSNVSLEKLRTCHRLFSRKTSRDERVSESRPSSTETVDQIDNIPPGPAPAPGPAAGHGAGWTLSVILCVNILILGAALISCSAVNGAAITPVHRQMFLIFLLSLTTLWMLYYTTFNRRVVSSKDCHAGPLWLRVGLVLFGLLSLIMDMFMIATYSGRLHCDSPVKVAFPCIQAVFIFSQTYFLWIHAKDCVQLHQDLTRCGLTVTLSCNLVLWMSAVVEEYNHHPDGLDNLTVRSIHRASFGDHECTCSFTSCRAFKEAYYYLYPFNIEYSLFASTMAYVMWRNVGRRTEEHARQRPKFRVKDVSVGPVAGVLLVLTGLATFILYEMQVAEEEQKSAVLLIHFITNIVIVSLMSLCTAAGCLLFCLDKRPHVTEENPTRRLDVGLLVAASMGQLVISYFSAVALVAEGHVNSLNLARAVMTVVQLGLQNLFLIAGLHREPFQENGGPGAGENGTAPSPVRKRRKLSFSLLLRHRIGWKRRLLKEICVFVLLANIILWVMPAFGARPQFDQTKEIRFYGFAMWAAIVNIGLPFGIFYRMHSVASLIEVYHII